VIAGKEPLEAPMNERLGILDWGIGGVGILRALRRRTRQVPVIYLSDSGYTPYGRLGSGELARRVTQALRRLTERGATSIIVACNAASTVLDDDDVRRGCAVPVSGVIEPALALTRAQGSGSIGILGGARTIRSGVYRRGLRRYRRLIVQRIAQPLSAHVEAGSTGSQRCYTDLERILSPLRALDAVLLACTHYPALAGQIAARLPGVPLLDPSEWVVERVLSMHALPRRRAADLLLTTGDPSRMRDAAAQAWGVELGACRFDSLR